MTAEPRSESDYSQRQTEAAHRVLIDIGQVLASFTDSMVLVGGWIPDLLLADVEPPHVGSIDVDIALDAEKLNDGSYADLIQLLLNTRRYQQGTKEFQLVVTVDLGDQGVPIQVDVEFLAPKEVKLKKHDPKLLNGFRVLQVDSASEAFRDPVSLNQTGKSVNGADNTVRWRVASLASFLVMKAHAIGGRDKPKDTYDLCYCLDYRSDNMETLAEKWKQRLDEKNIVKAVQILREKFASVNAFGPQQFVEFHNAADDETRAMQAQRAFQLVQKFLSLL